MHKMVKFLTTTLILVVSTTLFADRPIPPTQIKGNCDQGAMASLITVYDNGTMVVNYCNGDISIYWGDGTVDHIYQ